MPWPGGRVRVGAAGELDIAARRLTARDDLAAPLLAPGLTLLPLDRSRPYGFEAAGPYRSDRTTTGFRVSAIRDLSLKLCLEVSKPEHLGGFPVLVEELV